jgi:hypothetical protein
MNHAKPQYHYAFYDPSMNHAKPSMNDATISLNHTKPSMKHATISLDYAMPSMNHVTISLIHTKASAEYFILQGMDFTSPWTSMEWTSKLMEWSSMPRLESKWTTVEWTSKQMDNHGEDFKTYGVDLR